MYVHIRDYHLALQDFNFQISIKVNNLFISIIYFWESGDRMKKHQVLDIFQRKYISR